MAPFSSNICRVHDNKIYQDKKKTVIKKLTYRRYGEILCRSERMEREKAVKVQFVKAGGNASKNSYKARVSIPTTWLETLGITKEDNQVIRYLDGDKIVIEKAK